jgi:bifunctional UDP-N-acetylglucosamine pyrophosphorylase/glucosamine-1-phosphate N-acetyltransferase
MPKDTIVGQVCFLSGVDPLTLTRFLADELPDISWDTRDTNLMQLLFEVRLRIVKDNLRGGSAFARRVADYSASVDERADLGDLIGQSPALSAFVVDGLRLTSAGDELYQQAVGKVFPEKVTARVFLEIVRSIQQIARERGYVGRPEIVAAAYRIAASDLMFLKCPAYESLDSPQLFRSTVIGELPEQALECGARTEANLIRDLRGKYSVPTPGGNVDAGRATAVKITQHPEWSRLRSMRGRVSTRASTVAIVLAGGRSTRLASTIPKPVLPFRSKLLVSWVEDAIRSTTGGDVDIFLGVGFRDDLIRKALGNRVRYLRYEKTLGPGFRVAAALEMLAGHEGRVVVIYADVPGISPATIDALLSAVSTERTFGLVESYSDVSGYILKRDGRIVEIVQSRLRPPPAGTYTRDAGAYAFRNTEEFRGILGSVRNNNVRGEFMFADVVAGLARRGWDIRAVSERPSLARGINTPAELLALACGVADTSPATRTELSQMHATLADDYLLRTVSFESFEALNAAIGAHVGPLYFFRWWDALWS